MTRPRYLLAAVVPLLVSMGVCVAGETRESFEVSLSAGYDSNPLKLHDREDSGAYTEIALSGEFEASLSRRSAFFAGTSGSHRLHGSGLSGANDSWLETRAGFSFTPYRDGKRRLSMAFGGTFDLHRSTYIDPETGEIFEAGPDPAFLAQVPERFDYNRPGAFLNVRWRAHDRALFYVNSSLKTRSYVADYRESADLSPLDDETLRIRPGLRVAVAESVMIDFSWEWVDRTYEQLEALNVDGFKVPGTLRQYRYGTYRLSFLTDPRPGMDLSFGVRAMNREDSYAGYYDYEGTTAYVSFGHEVGDMSYISIYSSRRHLSYDNATIANDPDNRRLGSDSFRIVGEFERELSDRLTLLVEGGHQKVDDKDPLFAYDRSWTSLGLKFEL